MIEHLIDNVGPGLYTRVLAWANGSINSAELFFDIQKYAEENGIEYTLPLEKV